MDLISNLASAVGISPEQAQAVAGMAIGAAKSQVAETDPGLATQMGAAIPELSGWEAAISAVTSAATPAAAGHGGLLGSLASAASSGLGNQLLGAVAGESAAQGAQLAGLLAKLGLGTEHAALAAPVLLSFLESRLEADTLKKLFDAAPLLAGLTNGGGLAAALGGLLGR